MSVCSKRRSQKKRKKEIKKKNTPEKRIALLLWISDLIYLLHRLSSEAAEPSPGGTTDTPRDCLCSLDLHTGSHVSGTPPPTSHYRSPLSDLGEHNQDFLPSFFPWNRHFQGSADPRRDTLISGHWSGCECPLVWRPASSTPAPWITCLGL